jgi:hypothetical protein
MGFFKTMATSAGWAAGQKLVNGDRNSAEADRARLEAETEQAKQATAKNELDSIVTIKFGETSDEIAEALNELFAKAALLPSGFAALGDKESKAKKKAIIEKIEFGLFKLNKIDQTGADFFKKKYDNLVGQKNN